VEYIIFIGGIVLIYFLVTKQNQQKLVASGHQFEEDANAQLKEIEKNGLPIAGGLNVKLQKGEKLHHVMQNVDWLETRTVRTGNVGGAGFTSRIKVAKGLYFRSGVGKISYETKQEWKVIESGDFFMTNKRFFLIGQSSTKKIMITKILSMTANLGSSNGLVIKRDTGKDVLIDSPSFQAEDYAIAITIANEEE
jgi:hypothetical protein